MEEVPNCCWLGLAGGGGRDGIGATILGLETRISGSAVSVADAEKRGCLGMAGLHLSGQLPIVGSTATVLRCQGAPLLSFKTSATVEERTRVACLVCRGCTFW